jgi:hypothetical protein
MTDLPSKAVTLGRSFADGTILFEKDGVYFRVTRDDVAEMARLVDEIRRVEGSVVETRAPHPTAESLRQLADGSDGNMVSFTPNALRAMADAIDGSPQKTTDCNLSAEQKIDERAREGRSASQEPIADGPAALTLNLRTALEEFDKLRHATEVMRPEGIGFDVVLTRRALAMECLIESARSAVAHEASVLKRITDVIAASCGEGCDSEVLQRVAEIAANELWDKDGNPRSHVETSGDLKVALTWLLSWRNSKIELQKPRWEGRGFAPQGVVDTIDALCRERWPAEKTPADVVCITCTKCNLRTPADMPKCVQCGAAVTRGGAS